MINFFLSKYLLTFLRQYPSGVQKNKTSQSFI